MRIARCESLTPSRSRDRLRRLLHQSTIQCRIDRYVRQCMGVYDWPSLEHSLDDRMSAALVVERQSVLGVVFNPMVDELFTAVRGKGAFLNGKVRMRGTLARSCRASPDAVTRQPIHVAAAPSLEQAVVSTNVGYIRAADGIEFMLENIRRYLLLYRSITLSVDAQACAHRLDAESSNRTCVR